MLLDQALLQPGPWGRFRNLPVRRDVVEAIQRSGWQTLRLGGTELGWEGRRATGNDGLVYEMNPSPGGLTWQLGKNR